MAKVQWNTFTLEKQIPLPPIHPLKTSSSAALLEQMEVSDSFAVPEQNRGTLTNAIVRFRRTHKSKQFVTRAVRDGGNNIMIRCWRVK